MNKTTKILSIALMVFVALFIIQTVRSCDKEDKIKEQTGLLNSLNDSVRVWKDKDGLSHSRTSVITTGDTDDFLEIRNLKGDNKKLQETVAKYEKQIKKGGSVTNFTSETKTKIVTQTVVDTVVIDNTVYPVYKSDFNLDGWVVGNVEARPDSIKIDQNIKNEYTLVIGEDPQGFLGLGKAVPFAEVTNLNPYSTVPTLKTYQVNVKRKKNGWKYLVAGILVGGVTTFYLIK